MARVARGHGLAVEVAPFETWDPDGRQFDLVAAGESWHWVDGAVGAARIAGLLRPGGVFALLANFFHIGPVAAPVLDEVYRRHAPSF